jgi:hypothetical protein
VLLTVVAALAALEAFTRTRLFHASKDLSRFATYAGRARALCAAPGRRVAFIGNSATERGIDTAEFAALTGTTADAFVADASQVATWSWMLEAEFWSQRLSPDVVVLNFYEPGLDDARRLELGRLAQFFTSRRDWPDLFRDDVTAFDDRVDFAVASLWATYAVRDRIKERALDLVPGYARYLKLQNDVLLRHDRGSADAAPAPTRRALARLLERARAHGTHLLFVFYPLRRYVGEATPAPGPEEAVRMIDAAGMDYLDLRKVPGLEERHYEDLIHLGPAGRAIYTRYLAEKARMIVAGN